MSLAQFYYSSSNLGGGEGVDLNPFKITPPLTPPKLGGRILRQLLIILHEPQSFTFY